jgi:solute carrier family 36 (proton-coupled amino acid transporter)
MTETPTASSGDLDEGQNVTSETSNQSPSYFDTRHVNGTEIRAVDLATPSPSQESSLGQQSSEGSPNPLRIEAQPKKVRLQQRAATFSHPPRLDHEGLPRLEDADQVGSFRRGVIRPHHRRFHSIAAPITGNFTTFLDLYGSFAGEDLAESEDESAIETDQEDAPDESSPLLESGETRPLLGRRKSSRRGERGDASNIKSFFTLLKAFVGTGILFLPKAFKNGGILFSTITLVTVSLATSICFHLLLQCRKRYGGSYGDLGETIGGKRLRTLILASITISQIGFVCSGMIFTAENLFSFLDAVTPEHTTPISAKALIAAQLVVLIPLAFIRNISKLGPAALLADLFILLGLVYIYSYDISSIASRHGLHPTVKLFNPNDYALTVGSAIFTFEGIGLIIPIQTSMKRPESFSILLYTVMFIITVVFTAVGFLSYGTFGSDTKTEIITNFPQTSKFVNVVQFLYSLAVLIGTPVQLFPAVRIMEGKLFGHRSGKRDTTTKWKKNVFRTCIVILSALIAALGAGDLDKFVALIGSFACVPLVYIYPAYLHYKGIASTRVACIGDMLMMALGLVGMVYTTCITVKIWVES